MRYQPAPVDDHQWGLWAYSHLGRVARAEAGRHHLSDEQRQDLQHSLFAQAWEQRREHRHLGHRPTAWRVLNWHRTDCTVRVPPPRPFPRFVASAPDRADDSSARDIAMRLALLDMSPADQRIVRGLVAGLPYSAIARDCGYKSQSAVSNRIARLAERLSR